MQTYEAAIANLPGWSDEAIMTCDLGRLYLAIEAAGKAKQEDWKLRFRIAGFKLEEPMEEIEDDEEFNDRMREAMATLRRKAA